MQVEFTHISSIYSSVFVRSLRLIILLFILAGIYNGLSQNGFPNIPLFLFMWFWMLEVFMYFKIGKVRPTIPVSTSREDLSRSCTMPVLRAAISTSSGFDFTLKLASLPQANFILQRIGITKKNLQKEDLTSEKIIEKAGEVVREINAKFITSLDIVAAYLLLTEQNTKLLFKNEIKEKDLIQILKWARSVSPWEEEPESKYHSSGGSSFADGLLTGWTPETMNYTKDITSSAYFNNPQITGREKEFKEILESLVKVTNNNVLLTGEAGSGKENLVYLLAMESENGLLPTGVNNKRITELLIGPLVAGASDKGELEKRIQAIIEEISHAGNIILYIPEFQNILGSSSYGLDLSGALLPHLKSGSLPIIATMTKGNYKIYFDRNPLKETFDVIPLVEPSIDQALEMVFHKTPGIEGKFKVILTYNAVRQAVTLADRYFPDNALPGSAVTLLEDIANTISSAQDIQYFENTNKKLITATLVVKQVQSKTHISVAAPTSEEKELLLNLEAKLHERVISQQDAVKAISESLRRLRSGLASTKKPISFLFLGPTGVGKTETARALGDIYFGGEENILRLDMSEYTDSDGIKRLLGAPPGEGEERGELTDKIHDHPASLVLLDEFEKANPRIRDLFLQVLEDGRLTDNKGRTVSFINSIIVATSNAGSEYIREELRNASPNTVEGASADKAFKHLLLDHLQEKNIFTPELLNRFDDVIIFKPLGPEAVKEIVKLILKKMTNTLEEQDITIRFDDSAVSKIATEGQDIQFGARPLLRYIQDNVEDLIAQAKLQDKIVRGDKVVISVTKEDQFQISKE